jgi:hypothetical protein
MATGMRVREIMVGSGEEMFTGSHLKKYHHDAATKRLHKLKLILRLI